MALQEQIKSLASQFADDLIHIRRYLHQHPELSYHEYETAKFIAKTLTDYGLSPETGIAGNGVVALVEGKNPQSKTIALRADMDALPITEANEVVYKSQNQGVMHACWHDVHTTSLLGVARILQQLPNEFEGTVKLIFQPAEE
ncbi:MAG: amidohydrolase, partial [Verrucomicrobia bacterium]|nr:amidohydrolase [Cytophagales bacterium]